MAGENSVEELFHTSFHKVYRAAKPVCLDRQLAEDAVSEATIRLIKNARKGMFKPDAVNYSV